MKEVRACSVKLSRGRTLQKEQATKSPKGAAHLSIPWNSNEAGCPEGSRRRGLPRGPCKSLQDVSPWEQLQKFEQRSDMM